MNFQDNSESAESTSGKMQGRARPALNNRYFLIVLVVLLLLIPIYLAKELVNERSYLRQSVIRDIASSWGGEQVLSGPMLVVPVTVERTEKEVTTDAEGRQIQREKTVTSTRFVYVMPDSFDLQATLYPEERARNMYTFTVYTADVDIQASYALPDFNKAVAGFLSADLEHAYFTTGLSDARGIQKMEAVLSATGKNFALRAEPDTTARNSFRVPLPENVGTAFSIDMKLRTTGSGSINVSPVGETSRIALASSWPHPSFGGSKLPVERTVSPDGFTAKWEIPHLARSFGQLTIADGSEKANERVRSTISSFFVGVSLHEPVTYYTLVNRAMKYALLFICVTFVGLFAFEATIATRLHPLQYGLVGMGMVLFYVTLLSLSEHIGFSAAYAAASLVIIAMITAYIASSLRSRRRALGMAALLTALYLLLYALLQMEDYALIAGTVLSLLMLGVLMYITRNLAHSGEKEHI